MSIIFRRGSILAALVAAVIGTGVAIEAQKPSSPAAPLVAAAYRSPQEVNAALVAINKANPAQTALHRIATSPGGVDLTVLEIGPDVGQEGPPSRRPSSWWPTWRACCRSATEAALSLADRLLASPARDEEPHLVHPAERQPGRGRAATSASRSSPTSATRSKWNDDMDDQTDEDGPDDLDGNGLITEMRVKDPGGEWIPVEGEPRLMRKADPSKGEKGIYKLYTEGIDNDGDGEYNEDPPGGANIGITFPHLFHPWTATGGRWPGSEPETFGIMKFAIDHPEIAMTFVFGATELVPAAAGRAAARAASTPTRSRSPSAWRRASAPTRTAPTHGGDHRDGPAARAAGIRDHRGDDRVVPRPRRGRQPARRRPQVLQGAVGQVQGVPQGRQARRQAARPAAAEGRLVRAVVLLPPRRARLHAWTSGRCPR